MSERDPIDVAREVWPLEWTATQRRDGSWILDGHDPLFHVRMEGGTYDGEDLGWDVSSKWLSVEADDLLSALTEARRLTLARLETTAALCREPYPVQVERHKKTGEAVLFLTSPHNGEVMAIARYLLDAEPDIRELGDGTTAIRIGKFGGLTNMYSVTEPAEAIRETLRMLAEEGGA